MKKKTLSTTKHTSPALTNDAIPGRESAHILNLPWPGTFNRVRRRIQISEMLSGGEKMWKVPAWGGIKLPGRDWAYSRAACTMFAEKHLSPDRGASV